MMAGVERSGMERPHGETRHRAREAAIQMLYQWEIGKTPIEQVAAGFWRDAPLLDPDEEGADDAAESAALPDHLQRFAAELATGVAGSLGTLDPLIAEAADNWRIERMATIDRLILRLAVYEFLHQSGTPAPVVINEALELARTFSTDDAVKFINGLLDGIRKGLEKA